LLKDIIIQEQSDLTTAPVNLDIESRLVEAVERAWLSISEDMIMRLVDSIPACITAVVAAKG
jgi:hypothetical protein